MLECIICGAQNTLESSVLITCLQIDQAVLKECWTKTCLQVDQADSAESIGEINSQVCLHNVLMNSLLGLLETDRHSKTQSQIEVINHTAFPFCC